MCIFHKWGKWEQYETISLSYFYNIPCRSDEIRQSRKCSKCGKMEDKYVTSKHFCSITKKNIPEPVIISGSDSKIVSVDL